MGSRIPWRFGLIVGILCVLGAVGVYPLVASRYGVHSPSWLMDKQLKLGLDLKGGVHLVLRVETEVALKSETEQEMERLREALTARGITVANIAAPDSTHFRVDGVPASQDVEFRQASRDVQLHFDRSPAFSGAYSFTMKPDVQMTLRGEAVVQARQTIERRVNELGVAEPSIAQQGDAGDQILVQLPGIDVTRAIDIIRPTGFLELKIVEQGPAATREALLVNGHVPPGIDIIPSTSGSPVEAAATVYYALRKVAAVSGRDLRTARPSVDENNQPAVSFTLNSEGGRKFGKISGENIGRQLAIVLDGQVQSVARIDNRITTDGRLLGNFTQEEVQNLSLILRSGALPVPLDVLEQRQIGASLGADSIRSGIAASLVGLVLVAAFMLIYYKLSGVNAVVALIFNLIILLGLMAYIGAVMTLPGIAGFVLTMGIGVDSNVLIFERIKEELEAHRGADLCRMLISVRHRADSWLCRHIVLWSDLESVHIDIRVEDTVRSRARPATSGWPDPFDLSDKEAVDAGVASPLGSVEDSDTSDTLWPWPGRHCARFSLPWTDASAPSSSPCC
jgi:preprotein translocase subunit SecD